MFDILYLYGLLNKRKIAMEHVNFVVKCYSKQELAQLYFPDLSIRVSVDKLRHWLDAKVYAFDARDTGDGFSPENERFFGKGG